MRYGGAGLWPKAICNCPRIDLFTMNVLNTSITK